MNTKLKVRNSLLLLLAASIWGVAFVAQSVGMDYVKPFTFSAVRSLIGGVVLIPFICYRERRSKKMDGSVSPSLTQSAPSHSKASRKDLLTGGFLCGVLLFLATNLQQFGILSTSVGKAGFITACYIILVPVFHFLFFRKKTGVFIWISVAGAVAGLYLLCMTGSLAINQGDLLVLLCAIVFSFHILTIDHFSPLADGVKLSCFQFFVCAVLSAIPMFLFEHPQWQQILAAWLPILYAGALSCGIAYTLQIIGQENMNPTVASLILSMESVVSVLAGWLLLGQSLTAREITGCAVMFLAILLAQLPQKKNTKKKPTSFCESTETSRPSLDKTDTESNF